MSATMDIEAAGNFCRLLEDTEAERSGRTIPQARAAIAARIGVSPGTFENLRKLRSKMVPHWVMERIRAELITVLTNEIGCLQNEISIARQIGTDHRDNDLAAAAAQLVIAKEILRGAARGQ
jgi:hypothetical protein